MRQSLLRLSAHGHGAPKYVRFGPPAPPNPSKAHVFIAKSLGGLMSFWILYRFRQDYEVVFVSIYRYVLLVGMSY